MYFAYNNQPYLCRSTLRTINQKLRCSFIPKNSNTINTKNIHFPYSFLYQTSFWVSRRTIQIFEYFLNEKRKYTAYGIINRI